MTDLPSGVVTFLLTDVVGSTELWERFPQAMDRALVRHDEIVTETVAAEGGTVLKARGEGDSAFCVFARATDAVRAAQRLQLAIGAEVWPAETPLTVRAALHSGEAVERDRDFYGPAVNRAARWSIAPAGGVIVGSTTAALVVDGLPAGCAIVEIGRVRLRGFGADETVYALRGTGLAAAPGPDPTPGARRDTGTTGCVASGGRGARARVRAIDQRRDRVTALHLGAHRRVPRLVAAPQVQGW